MFCFLYYRVTVISVQHTPIKRRRSDCDMFISMKMIFFTYFVVNCLLASAASDDDQEDLVQNTIIDEVQHSSRSGAHSVSVSSDVSSASAASRSFQTRSLHTATAPPLNCDFSTTATGKKLCHLTAVVCLEQVRYSESCKPFNQDLMLRDGCYCSEWSDYHHLNALCCNFQNQVSVCL